MKNIDKNISGWIFHNHAIKILYEIIREIYNTSCENIFDFGAGAGIAAACIKSFFPEKDVFVYDIDENYIPEWEKRNLIYLNNFEKLNFDVVYCSHVLEHIENVPEILKKLSKITKKLILIVPDGPVCDITHRHIFDRISFLEIIKMSISYKKINYRPIYNEHINNLMAVIDL